MKQRLTHMLMILGGGLAALVVLALSPAVAEAGCQYDFGSWSRPHIGFGTHPQTLDNFADSAPVESTPVEPVPPGGCPAGLRCDDSKPAPQPPTVTSVRPLEFALFAIAEATAHTWSLLVQPAAAEYSLLTSGRIDDPPRAG